MKSKLLIIPLIAILVIIGIFIYFELFHKTPIDLSNPRNWIFEKEDYYELNVFAATEGYGDFSVRGLDYDNGEGGRLFTYESYYKGEPFDYLHQIDGIPIMTTIPIFKPDDGIIDSFILEKRENRRWVVYFFVDEDWKNAMPNTNIFWGREYDKDRSFNFNPLGNGIYYDKVIDDESRFSGAISSVGPIIGDLTREDQVDKTYVRII